MKTARKRDRKRIEELKKKINDNDYLADAINKIALQLTNTLNNKEDK